VSRPVVSKECVLLEVRDVQVDVAIVVEVPGRGAHAIAAILGAAALRYVLEDPVAGVAKELVPCAPGRIGQDAVGLHEIRVEVAIAIHVEERAAAGGDLRVEVACVVPGAVLELEAGVLRRLDEPRRPALDDGRRSLSTAAARKRAGGRDQSKGN
jgi:hypothetical protein